MNHYERNLILRKRFKKMQRDRTDSFQSMNKKQMFKNKRNRKRKRVDLEYKDSNMENRVYRNEFDKNRNNNLRRKRRKKSHSKHNKSDHIMSFLMSEILEETQKPQDKMDGDYYKNNCNAKNNRYNPFSLTRTSVSP